MPRVNADGNETVGVPSVQHLVPLGTYTGWNITAGGFFKGQPCGGGLTGGFIPFQNTKAEREALGDPRPSLQERYGTKEGFVCAVRTATKREIAKRFLLERDADRLIKQAADSDVLAVTKPTAEDKAIGDALCTN